jgi:ribosomal protein L37AE/L43A
MIELTSTTAMMLYLCLTLGALLGIWIAQHCRTLGKKIETSEQNLFVCEFCTFAYLADVTNEVTQCPQCQCYNKHNVFRK